MSTQVLKYIDDNPELGLLYDLKLIERTFRQLDCPKDLFDPFPAMRSGCKYIVDLSERSTGKTTQWLLVGLVMYWLYGCQTQYIRDTEDMILPKSTRDLFSVILKHDYVSKLTNGEYNTITYKARRWFLAYCDEYGTVIREDSTHFCFMASVDKAEVLKSGYNAPFGDLIIFDEFIGKYYTPNQFVRFCDLTKTIIRDRISPLIVMAANTIERHSQYFNELEIYDEVQQLQVGDHKILTSQRGTKIYVDLIGIAPKRRKKRSLVNQLFYGFKNPRLASITGGDWALDPYQHIPSKSNARCISRQLYIYHNSKYVRLDVMEDPQLGLCIYIHWATRIYDDSIILTTVDRTDPRYQYKLGPAGIAKLIKYSQDTNRIYYATNDVGSFVKNYLNYCKKLA